MDSGFGIIVVKNGMHQETKTRRIMENLEGRINQLGKDIVEFLEKAMPGTAGNNGFSPDVDIYTLENEVVFLIDLPGMDKDQVALTTNGNVLTVSGERASGLPEDTGFNRKERRFGRFSRSFALPEGANSSGIKAKFSKGVLRVSIPLNEDQKGSTHIDIE